MRTDVIIRNGFPMNRLEDLWAWLNTPREPNFDAAGGPENFEEFLQELELRLGEQVTWSIYAGEELVGYAAFVPDAGSGGQFRGMVIRPSWRGVGVGSAALELLLEDLRNMDGLESLNVLLFADNALMRHLFLKAGFTEGRQYVSMFKSQSACIVMPEHSVRLEEV